MNLEKYLNVAPEVKAAIDAGKPVVALESTIISHGMPYPQNVETALNVERIVRENGAVPATIAIIQGKITVGCTREQIEHLGKKGLAVAKASRRDLPVLLSRGEDGATTVTTTMIGAALAGIRVFAKVESREGVEDMPELLPASDMIVIARGDLGAAFGIYALPPLQKRLAAACRAAGAPFMVVTQLLYSMQQNPVPTRAEVSDIYNAVLDGAAALMLTNETAAGKYPAEAMRALVLAAGADS